MEGHRTLDAEVVQAVVGPMPTLGSSWDSAITRLLETNSLGEVSGPALLGREPTIQLKRR